MGLGLGVFGVQGFGEASMSLDWGRFTAVFVGLTWWL